VGAVHVAVAAQEAPLSADKLEVVQAVQQLELVLPDDVLLAALDQQLEQPVLEVRNARLEAVAFGPAEPR